MAEGMMFNFRVNACYLSLFVGSTIPSINGFAQLACPVEQSPPANALRRWEDYGARACSLACQVMDIKLQQYALFRLITRPGTDEERRLAAIGYFSGLYMLRRAASLGIESARVAELGYRFNRIVREVNSNRDLLVQIEALFEPFFRNNLALGVQANLSNIHQIILGEVNSEVRRLQAVVGASAQILHLNEELRARSPVLYAYLSYLRRRASNESLTFTLQELLGLQRQVSNNSQTIQSINTALLPQLREQADIGRLLRGNPRTLRSYENASRLIADALHYLRTSRLGQATLWAGSAIAGNSVSRFITRALGSQAFFLFDVAMFSSDRGPRVEDAETERGSDGVLTQDASQLQYFSNRSPVQLFLERDIHGICDLVQLPPRTLAQRTRMFGGVDPILDGQHLRLAGNVIQFSESFLRSVTALEQLSHSIEEEIERSN